MYVISFFLKKKRIYLNDIFDNKKFERILLLI